MVFGVGTNSHYATISGGLYQCNHSRKPVPFEAIPFAPVNGMVYGVLEVLSRPAVVPRDGLVVDRGLLQKAKRIAAKQGLIINSHGGMYEDPLEGCNETGDMKVLLELVQRYQECLEGGYLEAVTDPCLL